MPSPKAGLAGVTAIDTSPSTLPVPDRGTGSGDPNAAWTIDRIPARRPTSIGVNVTPIVHCAPAARLAPHVEDDTEKSPDAVMAPRGSTAPDLLLILTIFGLDVVPTVRDGNERLVGAVVTGATPLPDSATDCGLLLAPCVTVRTAAASPATVGA